MSHLSFKKFHPESKTKPITVIEDDTRQNKKRYVYSLMGEEEAFQRNRQEYLNWRANWRKGYKAIMTEIKTMKIHIRSPETTEGNRRHLFGRLEERRAIARSMMMALEATNAAYVATLKPRDIQGYETDTDEVLLDKAEQKLQTQ
jgi:hypothetical protein